MEESDSRNMYLFVQNSPSHYSDFLGLTTFGEIYDNYTFLTNPSLNYLSKEIAYLVALRNVRGDFAKSLLKHYLWGQGKQFLLTSDDVVTKLKPEISLTQSQQFVKEVVMARGTDLLLGKKYSLSTFDKNNPSGGLGRYNIHVVVDVTCHTKKSWQVVGTATVDDIWDFDWTVNNLINEWDFKIKSNIVFQNKFPFLNLYGREIRTALGSLLPGKSFHVTSENVPIKQSDNNAAIIFGK
jgi:hypothetical protein